MATQTDPIGAVLMFGDDLINKLNIIDKSLVNISKSTSKYSSDFVRAMEEEGGSVSGTRKQIKSLAEEIKSLSGIKDFSKLKKEVSGVADEVSRIINLLNRANSLYPSISGSPSAVMSSLTGLVSSVDKLSNPLRDESVALEKYRNEAWRNWGESVGVTSIEQLRLQEQIKREQEIAIKQEKELDELIKRETRDAEEKAKKEADAQRMVNKLNQERIEASKAIKQIEESLAERRLGNSSSQYRQSELLQIKEYEAILNRVKTQLSKINEQYSAMVKRANVAFSKEMNIEDALNTEKLSAARQKAEAEDRKVMAQLQKEQDQADAQIQKEIISLYQRRIELKSKLNQLDVNSLNRSAANPASSDLAEEEALRKAINEEIGRTDERILKLSSDHSKLASEAVSNSRIELQSAEAEYENSRKLEDAKLRLAEAERKRNEAEQKRHDEEIKRQEEEYRAALERYRNTPNGAMQYSKDANSIAAKRNAIQYLRNAMDNLDLSDKKNIKTAQQLSSEMRRQQAEIDKLTGKTRQLQSQHKGLLDVTGQLRGMLYTTFSVYQISNFAKKMVEVRGEFELQHKALQAILQDTEKADELWGQITQLAVKSPFRVKELVTYTKQLAAYRIDTDNLFDVTKRLADVSSGLGVDMQRLILAYGQVKAANYLRGQELRQFSEAGINILGELAEKFSEVEGRTVSVGEVFDRVSKRMVKFQDVAEIFEKITDEGGIFYQMQEKQAETLKGRISNLKDSFDLMYNDIGESSSVALNKVVASIKSLAENWQRTASIVLPLIGFIIAKSVALSSVMRLQDTVRSLKEMENGWKGLMKVVGGSAGVLGGYATIILAVAAAIATFVLRAREATRVLRDTNKIMSEGATQGVTLDKKFKELADTVRDGSKSYEEQQTALKKLKSMYGDILPSHMLELDAIRNMKDGYEAATKAIYAYTQAKSKENAIQNIQSEMGKTAPKQEKRLSDIFSLIGLDLDKNELYKIKSDLDEKILEGSIADVNQLLSYISRVAKEVGGNGFVQRNDYIVGGLKRYFSQMQGYVEAYAELEKYDEGDFTLNRQLKKTIESAGEADRALAGHIKTIEAVNATEEQRGEAARYIAKKLNEANDVLSNYDILSDPETSEKAKNAFVEMKNTISDIASEKVDEQSVLGILGDPINRDKMLRGLSQFNLFGGGGRLVGETKNYERLVDLIDGKNLDSRQKQIEELMRETLGMFNVDASIFENMMLSKNDELNEYIKSVKDARDALNDRLEADATGASMYITGITDENRGAVTTQRDALDFFYTLLAGKKEKKTGGFGAFGGYNKDTNGRIKLLQDMNKEYENLLKNFSAAESKVKVMESYADAWDVILAGTGLAMDDFFTSKEGLAGKLGELRPSALKEKLIKPLEKAIGDTTVEIDVALKTKNREEMKTMISEWFEDANLAEEIRKTGVTNDLAKALFGLDATSIDDVRKMVEDEWGKDGRGLFGEGTEGADLYKETIDKIEEMEEESLVRRLKDYTKYLDEAMNERVKIEYEYLEKVDDINEMFAKKQIDEGTRNIFLAGAEKNFNEAMNKQLWEDFKTSDTYVQLFEDLDSQSYKALGRMKELVEGMQEGMHDLNPTDLRNIKDQIEKLNDEMSERKPLRTLIDDLKNIRGKGDRNSLVEKLIGGQAEAARLTQIVDALQTASRLMGNGASDDVVNNAISKSGLEGVGKDNLNLTLLAYQGLLATQQDTNNETQGTISLFDKLTKDAKTFADQWKEDFDNMKDAGDAVYDMIDSLGGAGTEASKAFMSIFDSVMDITGSIPTLVNQIVNAETAINAASGWIGLIATAITLAARLVKSIAEFHDARIQDEMDDVQKSVDRLADGYERLQELFEESWNIDDLKTKTEAIADNIRQSTEDYERLITLERQKKKSDEDAIDDYYRQIEENEKKLRDNRNSFLQEVGGIGDDGYKSMAQSFADAWYEAFKETGDGLSGLEESWDEFFDNMMKKQIMQRVAQKSFETTFELIDSLLEDGMLTDEDISKIKVSAEKASDDFDASAERLVNALGWEPGSGKLSGLTESIQGMTEQTAELLASYLNSIRSFVAQDNTHLARIAESLVSTDNDTNPILGELRKQTLTLSNIYTLLDKSSVTSANGKGFKAVLG